MKTNKNKHPLCAALFFAAVPALSLAIVVGIFSIPLAIISGLGLFGLGLDVMLRGK